MQQDFLEALRKFALYFKLESGPKYGGAIDIETLTKVLRALNNSFQNYFDAELRNIYQKEGKITERVNNEIKALKEESRLLVVDLKFASFEAGLAPNSITSSGSFTYLKQPLQLKKEIFKTYEKEVFYSDLNDQETLRNFEKKFSKEERAGIFKPLEDTLFKPVGYSFKYGKSFTDLKKSFKPISDEVEKTLVPTIDKIPTIETIYKQYVVYEGEFDLFGPKPRLKKVLAAEKLERPIYPLQLHTVKEDNIIITLRETITAQVTYDAEEELYYISYPELDITVWGKEREEANEAFCFTFISLVRTIYNEEDLNLTTKATTIKQKLAAIIDQIKEI